ncbi:MAG TPA: hypothetical protein VFC63_27765 [Blastocatellia bacterium]|nr:hypothetical protein [Blastocatellia bacterium]
MSNNPRRNTRSSGQGTTGTDGVKNRSQIATSDQPADQSLSMESTSESSNAPNKSEDQWTAPGGYGSRNMGPSTSGSTYGRESWNEFSRRGPQPPERKQAQAFDRNPDERMNFYDQNRPTHEWERNEETDFPREGMGRPRGDYGRGRGLNSPDADRREFSSEQWHNSTNPGYGRDTGYDVNRRGGWQRRSEDESAGRQDYGRSSGRFGAERGNREFGQSRGYEDQQRGGRYSAEQGSGRGERSERMPGGTQPSMPRRDDDYDRGNRETTGQHRYGGRPERDRDQRRFDRQENDWSHHEERGRDYDRWESEHGSEGGRGMTRGGQWRGRQDRGWARDRIDDSYNPGDYGRQRNREDNRDERDHQSSERDRQRFRPTH